MLSRRHLLLALPLVLAACATQQEKRIHHLAFGEMDMKMQGGDVAWHPQMPPAKLVRKGKDSYIDFGHGVHVPLSKDAFYTLWEGPDYWLAYGAGWAENVTDAYQRSTRACIATMKLLMMTRTFAPDHLVQKDGGWRLKVAKAENYVRGVLALPGQPFPPQSDTEHSFGNVSAAGDTARAFAQAASIQNGSLKLQRNQSFNFMTQMGDAGQIVAVCCYLIPKKDVDLAYIRKFTRLDTRPVLRVPAP